MAIVTEQFFASLKVDTTQGRLFRAEDYDTVGDEWAEHQILISSRLSREQSWPLGSCIEIHGECWTVRGLLPATFEIPKGVAVWTASDLRATADRRNEQRTRDELIRQRAESLCSQLESKPVQALAVEAPMVVALQVDADIPGFQQVGPSRTKARRWAISSGKTRDVNATFWSPPQRGPEFASVEPKTVACVKAKRTIIPGRTLIRLSDKEGGSEPVYVVGWDVEVLDWASGYLVRRRAFRAVPDFKPDPDHGGRRLGLQFGTGGQYGDPSPAAETWMKSLLEWRK
jgi:hypothetical protein